MKWIGILTLLAAGLWLVAEGIVLALRRWLNAPGMDCNNTYDATML
ncbi:MAG: hypothetical protein ACK4E8_09715 [Lacibacter sp.]|jgi:hypothetical protein